MVILIRDHTTALMDWGEGRGGEGHPPMVARGEPKSGFQKKHNTQTKNYPGAGRAWRGGGAFWGATIKKPVAKFQNTLIERFRKYGCSIRIYWGARGSGLYAPLKGGEHERRESQPSVVVENLGESPIQQHRTGDWLAGRRHRRLRTCVDLFNDNDFY